MGYSLYITRREHWADPEGPAISLGEWVTLVESDPELRWEPELGEHFAIWGTTAEAEPPWLTWENGNLESKHPPTAMIRKMHGIAAGLTASAMGEEGEVYDSNGDEFPSSGSVGWSVSLDLWQRVRAFFSPSVAPDPDIPVGCRIRDALGRAGTVASVDVCAANGLGAIVVRYDDGRTSRFAALANGLERIDSSAGGI